MKFLQKPQPSSAAKMHICTLQLRRGVKTPRRVSNYVLAFECAGKADDVPNTSVRFGEAATQKAKAQPIRLHAKSLVSAKIDLRCRFVNYNAAAFREILVCTALNACNVYLKLMF